MNNSQPYIPAGLFHRLAAFCIDSLLIIVIELLAAALFIAALNTLIGIGMIEAPLQSSVTEYLSQHSTISSLLIAYLAAIWLGFFSYCWTRAGQTLGMKALNIKLLSRDGDFINVTQALIRLATSGFGLANFTVPFDPEKRGFHDIWAKTQVVLLNQNKKA